MILGITGTSGSGKHLAALHLQKKGWVILDADTMAHALYRPYTAVWKALVKRFGEGILSQDDTISREKLAKIVFGGGKQESGPELADLNAIVHPALQRALRDEIHRHFRTQRNVAVVAALWQELGLPAITDKLLLITTDAETAYRRIHQRDGIPRADFDRRLSSQKVPPRPDFTIENTADTAHLYAALDRAIG